MKFNYDGFIRKLGGEVVQEFDKYIVANYKYFDFKVYKKTMRNGSFCFNGNFRACFDQVSYFKVYMKENTKHKNLNFEKSVFVGVREKVDVECLGHGVFNTTPEQLINRGAGCPKCYTKYKKPLVKNRGLSGFISDSQRKFGNAFTYGKTTYKNTMTRTTITCKKHGDFETTPNTHLFSKYGCAECAKEKNTFRLEDYEAICENGSHIYLFELFDNHERFFEIGISKEPERRIKNYKKAGYTLGENISVWSENAGLVFLLEKVMHKHYNFNRYKPKKDFKGKTECFSFVDFNEFYEIVQGFLGFNRGL